MNTNIEEGLQLVKELLNNEKELDENVKTIIIPPFTHIYPISQILENSKIELGAQDISKELSGAFTGEVSVNMIKSAGAEYTIIGHSERRAYFNETNELLNQKINVALQHNVTPIYCVGEKLEEREADNHFKVIENQIEEGLFTLSGEEISNIIIAYEPVWAIGTGKTATPEQAQEIHAHIRNLLKKQYGEDIANSISILYGGSVKPGNAKEIFAQADVDGGLIGGASLKANDFSAIVNSFK